MPLILRRTPVAMAVLAGSLLVAAPSAAAQDGSSSDERELPGTVLEAEQRDDGDTNPTPWVIGSGIAAFGAIAVGGTLLQRRSARGSGSAA